MDGLCPPFCPQISSCAPTKHLSAAPGHVARHLGEEPGLCSDQPLGGSSGALSEPPGERDPRGRGLLRGPPWAGLRALYWGHQGARSSGDLSLAPLLSPPSYASALRSRRHKVPWPWLDLAWLEHNARPVLPPPWQRGRVLPPAPPPPSGLWSFRPEPLFRALFVEPPSPRHPLPCSAAFYTLGRVRLGRETPGALSLAAAPLPSPPAASHEKEMRGRIFSSVPFRSRKGPCAARGRGAGPLRGTATEGLGQLPPGDGEPAAG